jgi:hypothetical protein
MNRRPDTLDRLTSLLQPREHGYERFLRRRDGRRRTRKLGAIALAAAMVVPIGLGLSSLERNDRVSIGPTPPPPTPSPTPPPADARVTLTSDACSLSRSGSEVRPGILRLRFINGLKRLDAEFRVVRLTQSLTLEDLRRHPSRRHPALSRSWSMSVRLGETKTWSSPRSLRTGTRWAIGCWKDKISAPQGWLLVPVDVVGTIHVR